MARLKSARVFMPNVLKRRLSPSQPPQGGNTDRFVALGEAQADFECVGSGVRMSASVKIAGPMGLSVGNAVQVGADVVIDAEGGVFLCDGAEVGAGAVILSTLPMPAAACTPDLEDERIWSSVHVGDDVRIGAGACVMPGVTLSEGAQIAPGAMVTKDVPAGARFGFTHATCGTAVSVLPETELDTDIPATDPAARAPLKGRRRHPDICFIASTGRSGSTTIADLLHAHPGVIAKHESRLPLIKLSTEYAHGLISREQAKHQLERIFLDGSVFHEDRIYVESDLKYFNLFPILNEIFPEARFIWMIRNGFDVVTSTVARSWFAGSSHPVWASVPSVFHKYRLQGDACGDVAPETWAGMTPFERNCWYWAYVNRRIEEDMALLPQERTFRLRLEDLGSATDDLLAFIGARNADLAVQKSNPAFYDKAGPETWTAEEKAAFAYHCGPMMARLYG